LIQNPAMVTNQEDINDGTQSIERAITVLRMLATRGRFGWGLSDLASASGLKKATTHRILSRLERERLVHRRGAGDRYFLGPMLGELSLSIPGFHEFVTQAQAFIADMAHQVALVTILSMRSGDHFVVGARVASSRLKGELNEVGARRPLISTAGGVAILAALTPDEQAAVVRANMAQLSLRGRTSADDFMAMWERSRGLGYGTNFGDIAPGVNAVAVATRDASGRAFGSITFAGPELQLPVSRCEELLPVLERHAAELAELAVQVHPGLYGAAESPG
jgi:DNA-binding IclR family transcriptional regulator